MCGRTVLGDVSWGQYHEWLNIIQDPGTPELSARYNIPPTTMNPIFIADGDQKLGVMARWGLVPHWYHDALEDLKYSTFNARAEDAEHKPAFREAFEHSHCLVPVQGYYEWQGPKGNKIPYLITVNTNAPAFCLAGLYSRVTLPDFDGYTYTILTEPSYEPVKHIHDRIPVMIDETNYDDWLNASTHLSQIKRIGAERINFHRVDKSVGSVKNEGPQLVNPVE